MSNLGKTGRGSANDKKNSIRKQNKFNATLVIIALHDQEWKKKFLKITNEKKSKILA
jgi:hypothetical protein